MMAPRPDSDVKRWAGCRRARPGPSQPWGHSPGPVGHGRPGAVLRLSLLRRPPGPLPFSFLSHFRSRRVGGPHDIPTRPGPGSGADQPETRGLCSSAPATPQPPPSRRVLGPVHSEAGAAPRESLAANKRSRPAATLDSKVCTQRSRSALSCCARAVPRGPRPAQPPIPHPHPHPLQSGLPACLSLRE